MNCRYDDADAGSNSGEEFDYDDVKPEIAQQHFFDYIVDLKNAGTPMNATVACIIAF